MPELKATSGTKGQPQIRPAHRYTARIGRNPSFEGTRTCSRYNEGSWGGGEQNRQRLPETKENICFHLPGEPFRALPHLCTSFGELDSCSIFFPSPTKTGPAQLLARHRWRATRSKVRSPTRRQATGQPHLDNLRTSGGTCTPYHRRPGRAEARLSAVAAQKPAPTPKTRGNANRRSSPTRTTRIVGWNTPSDSSGCLF